MHFEWDQANAASNAKKHGVRFPEAVVAPEDVAAITIQDPDSEGEDRFVSIGADDLGRVLVTIFTYRSEAIRIISARRANKRERRLYEDAK